MIPCKTTSIKYQLIGVTYRREHGLPKARISKKNLSLHESCHKKATFLAHSANLHAVPPEVSISSKCFRGGPMNAATS